MPEHEYAVELVDIEGLIPNDENVNHGDIGAIATAIALDGWHSEVICQSPTTRRKRPKIFAGEHRWRALQLLNREGFTFPDGTHRSYEELAAGDVLLPPQGKIPAQLLPLADLRALRKMVADNRAARLATVDESGLAELLQGLEKEDGLLGSLYEPDDLEATLRSVERNTSDGPPEGFAPTVAPVEYRCPSCGHEWQGARQPVAIAE